MNPNLRVGLKGLLYYSLTIAILFIIFLIAKDIDKDPGFGAAFVWMISFGIMLFIAPIIGIVAALKENAKLTQPIGRGKSILVSLLAIVLLQIVLGSPNIVDIVIGTTENDKFLDAMETLDITYCNQLRSDQGEYTLDPKYFSAFVAPHIEAFRLYKVRPSVARLEQELDNLFPGEIRLYDTRREECIINLAIFADDPAICVNEFEDESEQAICVGRFVDSGSKYDTCKKIAQVGAYDYRCDYFLEV